MFWLDWFEVIDVLTAEWGLTETGGVVLFPTACLLERFSFCFFFEHFWSIEESSREIIDYQMVVVRTIINLDKPFFFFFPFWPAHAEFEVILPELG